MNSPFFGVFLHWLGGLASASFYLPFRGVRKWSWESYWLIGGIFSWIVAPWIFASILVPDLLRLLSHTPSNVLLWSCLFGALWGVGGLTFGLTMRYLGIALGMAVALGYCAAFGTLVPPIFSGEFSQILATSSGRFILLGVFVCLIGIAFSGLAGMSKERELSEEEKKATIQEFHFTKGMLLATFSGIMSACFAYGLAAGKPLAAATKAHLLSLGHSDLWQNLPVLIVVLIGGFATNFVWCAFLHIKNRSAHEYFTPRIRNIAEISATEGVAPWNPSQVTSTSAATPATPQLTKVPLLSNYLLAAIAGVTWYLQFFFYSMGQTKMGRYDFSSWTLHMASIIIFSTLWGITLHEWRGVSKRTRVFITLGLLLLVGSTVIIGYANYLKGLGM